MLCLQIDGQLFSVWDLLLPHLPNLSGSEVKIIEILMGRKTQMNKKDMDYLAELG